MGDAERVVPESVVTPAGVLSSSALEVYALLPGELLG